VIPFFTTKDALDWNPQVARRRGRSRKTWRRTIEEEIREMGKTEERLSHWQSREEDGEASQEPCVPLGTKGIKSSFLQPSAHCELGFIFVAFDPLPVVMSVL
jgi:hypothetical protein